MTMPDAYANGAEDYALYLNGLERIVIRDGAAWKVLGDGRQETASPGECAAEIERLTSAVRHFQNDRDYWLSDGRRLAGGLIAITKAKQSSAEVIRSVAYDIVLNCLPPEAAEHQLKVRNE